MRHGRPARPLLLLAAARLLFASDAQARSWEARTSTPVVAGGGVVAMIEGDRVRLQAADGRLLATLGGDLETPPGRAQAPSSVERSERVLDQLDVPEDERDTQAAEDLVEDELSLSERRSMRINPLAPLPAATPLAVGTDRGVLVAVTETLWLVERGRPARRLARLPGDLQALAASADGRTVVVARGTTLLASADGGESFAELGATDTPTGQLTLAGDGSWLAWIEDDFLVVARGDAERISVELPAGARSLRACGNDLVLLAGDGLYLATRAAALRRVAGPLPAEQLACSADGLWLAAGPSLLASGDRGRSWRARLDAPATPILGAALTSDGIWLATRAGLLGLPLVESSARPLVAAAPARSRPAHPGRGWARLLPRLALDASYADRPNRKELRAFALIDFRLGLRPPPLPALAGVAFADLPLPDRAPPSPLESSAPARTRTSVSPDRELGCLEDARTQAVALALAEPERARSFVRRAGNAAWLPELRLRAERTLRRNESLDDATATADSALGLATVNDVRYEARATWDLGRLVFSPDEIAAEYQALRMADMRREIESQVNRLYFERRRLLVHEDSGGRAADDAHRVVRIEELDAELDTLSGGAFSRCRRPGREVSRP
jgi:hypothetical protein